MQQKRRQPVTSFRNLVLTTFVVFIGSYGWYKLTEPMTPMVTEFGNYAEVRWGNRFQPFVYKAYESREEITMPDGRVISEEIVEDPYGQNIHWSGHTSDVDRRLFEGQVILKEYLEKQESAPQLPKGKSGLF